MFNHLLKFSDKPVIKPWPCLVVSDTTRPCLSFCAALLLGGFTQGFSLGLLKYWSDFACTRLAPSSALHWLDWDMHRVETSWALGVSPSHQRRWSDESYVLKAPACPGLGEGRKLLPAAILFVTWWVCVLGRLGGHGQGLLGAQAALLGYRAWWKAL